MMRDWITIDILKTDEKNFSPIPANYLIYINTLRLDRNLLHGLEISFKRGRLFFWKPFFRVFVQNGQILTNRLLHLKKTPTTLEKMMKATFKMQLVLEICLQRWQLNKKFRSFCQWWVKSFVYYQGITLTATKKIKKIFKNPTGGWMDYN